MNRQQMSSDVQLFFTQDSCEPIPLAAICLDSITFLRPFDYDAAVGVVEMWINGELVSSRRVSIQRGIGRQFTVRELRQ